MKTFNNEISVHRGETFSIDKSVQNKDGSPYVISSKLNNPYFLLTVSTTRYEQEDRYLKNYWLDLSNFPKFLSTQAFDLKSLMSTANGSTPMYPNGFDDITARSSVGANGTDYLAYGYIGSKLVFLDYDDCVFYVEDDEGNRTYKYWDDSVVNGDRVGWLNYKCKITKAFSQEDTREWVEQSYTYSIKLVSGQLMSDYLNGLCISKGIDYVGISNQEKYGKLIEAGHLFPKEFNVSRVIGKYDVVMPILVPTKMSVLSSINGGL